MGLSDYYKVTDNCITSTVGSEFIFAGLHHNIANVKGIENTDICWIEEAQTISADSLKVLIPTIRKEGSELWFSFNPKNESDAIMDYINNPRPNSLIETVNYYDNPYISQTLLDEANDCRVRNYEDYKHVWLGECQTISDAVIFKGKYSVKDFIAPDNTAFCYGGDFGFSNDPSTLIRCYELDEVVNSAKEHNLYIDFEAYGIYPQSNLLGYYEYLRNLYKTVPLADKHTVNFDCARPEIINDHQRNWNRLAKGEPKLKIESGIAYLLAYHNIYIHPRCIHTLDEFGKYSYKLDGSGNPTSIPADKDNHIIDAIRYALYYKIKNKTQIHFSNGSGLNI